MLKKYENITNKADIIPTQCNHAWSVQYVMYSVRMPAEFRRRTSNVENTQISTFDISVAKLIDLNQLALDYVKRKLDSALVVNGI